MVLLEGDLSNISLFNLLQFIKLEQKSCILKIVIKEINQEAKIYFKYGNIVHAEVNSLQGNEAMYRVICWWNMGKFELHEIHPSEIPMQTIDHSLEAILIASAKRIDECADFRKVVLSLTSVLSFTQEAISVIKKGLDEKSSKWIPTFVKELPRAFSVARFFEICKENELEACNTIKRLIETKAIQSNIIAAKDVSSSILDSLMMIVMEFIGFDQSQQIVQEASQELDILNKEPGFAQLLALSDKIEEKLSPFLDEDKLQEVVYRMRARITSLI